MAAAGPGDIIQLEAGYSNEIATVTHSGMTITGEASSTGIVLNLGIGIATVTLAGTAPINLADASDGNGIVGNDGANLITVTAGADSVSGGLGEDRLFVDYRLATGAITGDSTSNVAEAGGGARLVTINGGIEHFTIWTGAGADTITTGNGNDDIRTGEGAGTITAGEGFNTIITGSGADTITAGNGGNFVNGGNGTNTITTGSGIDEILSGTGADTIVAGAGADRITITGGADTADAGAGSDLIIIDYSAAVTNVTGGVTGGDLAAGYSGHIADLTAATLDFVGVERMWVTSGSGNDVITTGGGNDAIVTGSGNDTLLAHNGGNDTLIAGEGNDFLYYGGALTASDSNDGGAGTDTVALLGDYNLTLGANSLTAVERLVMYSGSLISGPHVDYQITTIDSNVAAGARLEVVATGLLADEQLIFNGGAESDGSFSFRSGAGDDILVGSQQADIFAGGGGNDQLYGLGGNDRMLGGLGADVLRGGGGSDTYVYEAVAESTSLSMDHIGDFQLSDLIDLAAIDANSLNGGNDAFTFIGADAFHGVAGELRAYQSNGGWFVEGDTNGDLVADLVIQVDTIGAHPMVATDFIL
jgi:Ca2+-binding RTX toxin-like protein